jgi:hypothetical protein
VKLFLVTILLIAGVAACGSEAPTAVVRADFGGDTPVTASVYDRTGIVTSVETLPSDAARMPDGVTVSPDGQTLDVRWTGGIRHREPPVTITRDGQQYLVDVNVDGGGDIFSFIVPSTDEGLFLGLRFHLATPVTLDEVRLHVHGMFG